MRCVAMMVKRLACVALCLAPLGLGAQEDGAAQAARRWAWDQLKARSFRRRDARGNELWNEKARPFLELAYAEQNAELLRLLGQGGGAARMALAILRDRPTRDWAPAALASPAADEAALCLLSLNHRAPGADPYAYLEPSGRLERPWTEGLGLHLEAAGGWRFQWIPSPVLLPGLDAPARLPRPLGAAPVPGALLHLRQLRPGLLRLRALAGGDGIPSALASGGRAGFLLRHVERWLAQAAPALEPLSAREAWVLHYGAARGDGGPEGTLLFLPGELPFRTRLVMGLLKLNPTSHGARSRSASWEEGGARFAVEQLRGSGGVLHVFAAPEGTWIADREAPLRALLFPKAAPRLGERSEWCRVALAGEGPSTEASLWVLPRLGAGAAFERVALRRRAKGLRQGVWPNPFIAKAAPRTVACAMALGAGPTEVMLGSFLRVDGAPGLEDPAVPRFAEGGLSPEQSRAHQRELAAVRARRQRRDALRLEAEGLKALLDLRGAALAWDGWVAQPTLDAAAREALARHQQLRKEGAHYAARAEREGKVAAFGGFGEPGMAPAMALALPVQAGREAQVRERMARLWPRLFQGTFEKASFAGVELHRIRTAQAFAPAWAVVRGHLVLATEPGVLKAVASGLMGQAPTLADLPSQAFGRVHVDGARVAKGLESLLLAYLRSRSGASSWEEPAGADASAAELASTFGPFLGAVEALGSRQLELVWGPGGLEARPR